jgi:hypothetical protein
MDLGSFSLQTVTLMKWDIADHKHFITENISFRITKNAFQKLTKQATNNSANV